MGRGTLQPAVDLTLALDPDAAVGSGLVSGRVHGRDGSAMVALLRVEQSPAGVHAFQVDSGRVSVCDGAASFELHAPPSLPPQATGRRCGLQYVVRVSWRPSRLSRKETIHPVSIRPAEPAVHEGHSRLDRIIPSQPGRDFHLELVAVELEGGGHIEGRIHRDAASNDRTFVVTAECSEFWCTNFRFRGRRSPLIWNSESLWSTSEVVSLEENDRWGPFRFEIPPQLPAATEARVIAWRYSIEARVESRRPFTGHAVLTPLWFEV